MEYCKLARQYSTDAEPPRHAPKGRAKPSPEGLASLRVGVAHTATKKAPLAEASEAWCLAFMTLTCCRRNAWHMCREDGQRLWLYLLTSCAVLGTVAVTLEVYKREGSR